VGALAGDRREGVEFLERSHALADGYPVPEDYEPPLKHENTQEEVDGFEGGVLSGWGMSLKPPGGENQQGQVQGQSRRGLLLQCP
jgi:hypothetical protein